MILAFQILHFKKFLQETELPTQLLEYYVTTLNENPSPSLMSELEDTDWYKEFMSSYTEYTHLTLEGFHGKTAQ